MADDIMPNGNGGDMHDAAMRIGVLSQRTTNLEGVVGDIRRELNTSIGAVNASIANMSSKFDEKFNALNSSLAERSRPQWQAMSVMLAALVVAGGLVYWPIRENTSDLKSAVQLVSENMLPRKEADWRADRGKEDRMRTESYIVDLRANNVTRAEWQERNLARDHDTDNLRQGIMRETANLQRQIDGVASQLNSIFGTRDIIADTRVRMDRLEERVTELLRVISAMNSAPPQRSRMPG